MPRQPYPTTEKAAYSIDGAVALLSIGRTTLYACIKSGKLRATKLGRKTLLRAKDIDAFLDGLQQDGGAF